jgi:hypothetical protein
MSGLVEPSAPPRATRGPVTGHETDGSDTHKLDCYRCGLGDFRTRDLAHDFLGVMVRAQYRPSEPTELRGNPHGSVGQVCHRCRPGSGRAHLGAHPTRDV